jgi:HEAT repeat protein
MRSATLSVLLAGLFVLTAAISRAAGVDDDPVIGGVKLSELIEKFKAAKTAEERSKLASAIGRGKAKSKAAAPVLASALQDKDKTVRTCAARALGEIGPDAKAAVPDLTAALKETDAFVRSDIIGALGSIGPDAKTAVPELTEALKEKNTRVRVAAGAALYGIDKDNAKIAVPILQEVLKDKDPFAQANAAQALKAIGADAKDAVPDLMAVLAKGGMPAYYAREALGKIPAAEAALVAALNDPDKKLQEAAAGVLKEYFPEAAKKAGLKK